MTPNDIEDLLQQYGADQRQQQKAAEHVRHLAHRQAQRRTALACVVVLVAIVGVVMHRWQQLPEPTGTLVAEQMTITTPHTSTMPPSIEHIAAPTVNATTRVKTTPQSLVIQSQATQTHCQTTIPDVDYSDYSSSTSTESPIFADPITPTHPIIPSYPINPITPSTPSQHKTPQASRLHFTASIGASTISNASMGMKEENMLSLNGISSTTNHSIITPGQNLSANVGVAYTVASNYRSHLDVGVALSGYTGQCNIHIHEFGYTYSDNIEENNQWTQSGSDGLTPIPNSTTENYTFNTFSLYASVPLTLNLHPRGTDHLGWQLSLTPAHSLTTNRSLGHITALNPWKLTFGIGIALPNNVVRHISLTANLLPLYTSHSLHEFGIEIGI